MLERDTGHNPDFLLRLNQMQNNDPAARAASGISSKMQRFVEQAIVEARLAIYARYLQPQELAFMRRHYGKQMHHWPALIAEVRQVMATDTPASSPQAQTLGSRWMAMFRSYAGDEPATQARIRQAHVSEPELLGGSFVDEALLDYLRQIWAAAPVTRTAGDD
ncbi:MAG: hypothetical protein ABW154_08700 [Dyella sp.]